MANTVRVSEKLDYLRDSAIERVFPNEQTSVSTTSELYTDNTQIVGTTHELIAAGDVTDDAIARIENLSTTATVLVGGDSGGSFVEWFSIPPGYPAAIIPQVGALASTYLKASGASTPIRVSLFKISA